MKIFLNKKYFITNSCLFSDMLLEKISKSGLFTDISFYYVNYDYLKNGFALNVGNPHLVFFVDTLDLKKFKKD